MGFYIYDDIYDGSYNRTEAKDILISHVENIKAILGLIDSKLLLLKSQNFSKRQLTEDLTIAQYIAESYSSNDSKLRTYITLFNSYLANKTTPPIKTCSYNGFAEFLILSKVDVRYYNLISPNISACQKDFLTVNSSLVRNFFSKGQIESYEKWCYECTSKHDIKEDKMVNGKLHTAMDLSDTTAQTVLTQSIKIKKKCYSYCNDTSKWYTFHIHQGHIYHGYPIEHSDVPNKIVKFIENKPDNAFLWQIILQT